MAKILIVDDEDEIRQLLTELLDISGYETIAASSGIEGVEKYKENNPDLVIMDLFMEESGGGLTAIVNIKKYDPEAQIIVLTALRPSGVRVTLEELGIKDIIDKPYRKDDLLVTIEKKLNP
jgi:two-component system chemotaxis response regulator CheY